MSFEIHRLPCADDLAADVAARILTTIAEIQAEGRPASLVLTGGRIAERILDRLACGADRIDWHAVDLWWGDERYLPAGDPQRNDHAADRLLLDQVDIPTGRVHRIAGPDTSESAEESADTYRAEIAEYALRTGQSGLPRFDIELLSIGPDGHVASLFPQAPALEATDPVVGVHGSPKPPPTRITMTYPLLNSASQAWLLASGPEKAHAVALMTNSEAGPLQIPAAGIRAVNRTLLLLDEDAASQIDPGIDGR